MKNKKTFVGTLAAVCLCMAAQARAFQAGNGQEGGALEQLGLSAGQEAVEAVSSPVPAGIEAAAAPAGEKEINDFLDSAVKRIKSSDDPRGLEKQLRAETEAIMSRSDSPGAVMTLMIFRDKNIRDLVEAREAELYKKNTSALTRAEQAAAEMRRLVEEEKASGGILGWIQSVSVEKDILGRPRLKLAALRPWRKDCKVVRSWVIQDRAFDADGREIALDPHDIKEIFKRLEKFETAVAWNFSDYPQPHPMSGFGVGYRIEYDDAVPAAAVK